MLVTGITGFVGSAVAKAMRAKGWQVVGQAHQSNESDFPTTKLSITSQTDWSSLLSGVDLVIHCAALAPRKGQKISFDNYLETNTKGTVALAQQSVAYGVKRLIFISSVKVNGETSSNDRPFTRDSLVAPEDDYGISKYEAERALLELNHSSDLQVTIVRSPLVYGPGVTSNFSAMLALVNKQVPLPFGAVRNRRSLVFIGNLVDLIDTLATHPNVAGKIFFVSDDHDVSTTELFERIGAAMDLKVTLLPIPNWLLIGLCLLFRRQNISNKLLRSLKVDISSTKADLEWSPPVSFEQGIAITVRDYLDRTTR